MRRQNRKEANVTFAADRREFIKISQAVGMGFLIMGAIGYFIKLSKSNLPFNLIDTASSWHERRIQENSHKSELRRTRRPRESKPTNNQWQ